MALRGGLLPTGDLENRIKELHYGMEIGRTSCHQFLGQSVPRADDRRGLRTVAGAAIASGAHGLRPGTSLHANASAF